MSESSGKIVAQSPPHTEDVLAAIDKLKGRDRVGSAGQIVATTGGAAAGASAAGAIAGAAGASTLLGSTSLASALPFLVAATPVVWIAGCAVAGAAMAYGVSRLIRSGGRSDRVREEIVGRLMKRLEALEAPEGQPANTTELRQGISEAVATGVLSSGQAARMVDLIEEGKLDPDLAFGRLKKLLPRK